MGLARLASLLALGALLGAPPAAQAQDVPTVLTDKVYKGQGVIDVLKDVGAAELQQYFDQNGRLMLGIDVNEDASGNESSRSLGIALESIELVIRTTEGDFTFSDFYTSTSAALLASGSTQASEYYTAFGTGGSNNITGGTSGFDLSRFDDVIYLDNVSFSGQILGATINVTFLDTAKTGNNTNESFFDYSGGFEDFALLGGTDAGALEAANVGLADAPSGVTYSSNPVSPPSTPGAPAPPLALLLGLAALGLWKRASR